MNRRSHQYATKPKLQDGMAELRKNLNAELMGVLSHISLVENLNEMRPTQDYENPFPLLIQQLEECRQRQDEQLKTFMDLFKTLSLTQLHKPKKKS